jgi:hypothetical protein
MLEALLEALQQAGFMDGMKVHGWCAQGDWHQTFSEHAQNTPAARWKRKRKETDRKVQDSTVQDKRQALLEACLEHSTSVGRLIGGLFGAER